MRAACGIVLSSLLLLAPPTAAGPIGEIGPDTRSIGELAERFARKARGAEAEKRIATALGDLAKRCPGFSEEHLSPYVESLRDLASAPIAATPAESSADSRRKGRDKRSKPIRPRTVKGRDEIPARPSAEPACVVYDFVAKKAAAGARADRRLARAIEKGEPISAADIPVERRLELMLLGCLPEAEMTIAAIERRLDVHDRWDRFAELLQAWRVRCGGSDESFYEAMDRTAGTEQSLFYFDAMLSEFVRHCGTEADRRAGDDQRVRRFQQAFLAYRQYRALIEAVAFSLVLPPDAPLPDRLARYDYPAVPAGRYSLRHMLDVLLDHEGGDARAVVALVRDVLVATPPPEDIAGRYEPMRAFIDRFQALIPEMCEKSMASTDAMGERSRAARKALADSMRACARDAIQDIVGA